MELRSRGRGRGRGHDHVARKTREFERSEVALYRPAGNEQEGKALVRTLLDLQPHGRMRPRAVMYVGPTRADRWQGCLRSLHHDCSVLLTPYD